METPTTAESPRWVVHLMPKRDQALMEERLTRQQSQQKYLPGADFTNLLIVVSKLMNV
jgi:hypothetical protein